MNKLKTFFHTFTKSLTEPAYYNHILRAKFSFSLKYLLLFYLLFSIASAIIYNFTTKPEIADTSSSIISQLTTEYPSELTISLENNQLSINGAQEPLTVPFPMALSQIPDETSYDHLATLDTATDQAAKGSLFTLTKNELIVRQLDGSKQHLPYADIDEDLHLDKNSLGLLTSSLQSYANTLLKYSPLILFFILVIFKPITSLIVLAFYSIFIHLYANLSRKNLSYKKVYQLSLHTFTFAETAVLLKELSFPDVELTFFFPLAFFGASIIILNSIKPQLKTNS